MKTKQGKKTKHSLAKAKGKGSKVFAGAVKHAKSCAHCK